MDNQVTDDRIVAVYLKIRTKIAEVTQEYDDRLAVLKSQQQQLKAEILKRLHERGATQTKTDVGTAFIVENVSITIADEIAYGNFVLEQQDYGFYQKRAKVEHVREYMKAHGEQLPPGLSIFRELDVNVRKPRPKKGAANGAGDGDTTGDGEPDTGATEAA
jgi:hypothetical protein